MDWIPVASEKGARLLHSPHHYIPYILSRVFELNEVDDRNGGATLIPRDLAIPSILIYINAVKPNLQAIYKLKDQTSYSKLTFVEKLDQADIWFVEIKGQYHGRIVHECEFQDASEPFLRAAFSQILPFFRLMLQMAGTLEVYVGPRNLTELESLEKVPGLKVPGNAWYSFSREDCFICEEAARDITERIDFGGLVPHEQRVLPLGRDAIDILSPFYCIVGLSSKERSRAPRNTSTCMDSYDGGIFDMKLVKGVEVHERPDPMMMKATKNCS
ncbi:hypothetical protein M413DRAFT_30496 [Hebeloma cylindrosporum]|uniref:Uncharacterized protein n=1 Tax=Hebeloma cylindrosporum TaxID=76867 RepID=A0A0C3C3G5_HEBCY|nr:hypothetical protein M413DRAFT_30496 [Hebeloma cylindrosporum h7]